MVGVAAVVVLVVGVSTGGASVATPAPSAPVDTGHGPERLTPPVPSLRAGAAIAYDAVRHEVVLFGGVSDSRSSPSLNDTWTFRGRHWTERDPVTRPGPLDSAEMVYDSQTHTCLLVSSGRGAGPAVTWSWDGTTWTQLPDVPFGADETLQALASDPTTGHALLLSVVIPADGPPSTATHTWTWDGHSWTPRHPRTPFPAVPIAGGRPILASMGSGASGRLGPGILAVFENGDGLARTLAWDGSTWSQVAVGATPPYNPLGATMAEDATAEDVVLIGLGDTSGDPGSTWLWNGKNWHAAGPAPLIDSLYGGTTAVSDSASAHAVVIGESSPDSRSNQFDVLWTFDGRGWGSDRPA